MTESVKDLIRSIRGCRTAAEERAVLAGECANIRSSLHSESLNTRRKNICKLLLIHLLGYPTNFGQIECIKLVASSKFVDKRIGYLALNLLLTEDTEVLMLAINSIKMDLNSANPFVCELALRALANSGNEEMFQELQYEVESLLKSNVVNIRKNAAICAARMLRKLGQANLVPDESAVEVAQTYLHSIPSLLGSTNHGLISSGLGIMSVLIEYFPKLCDFVMFYDMIVRTLRAVSVESESSRIGAFGASKDYDINGINDPFLQVKLLALLRKVYGICSVHLKSNDDLYDLISQIVKNSNSTTISNYAVLYECARTIYREFCDPRFSQLGKDVVGKFMTSNDNNVKYIALGILNNFVDLNLVLGDTNWSIIVQSLRQSDISIRRRALDVSLRLVNKETLKPLMQYLFDFLLVADNDLKCQSIPKIAKALNVHSNCPIYKLDTLVRVFTIAGNCVPDEILHNFIASISLENSDTQTQIVKKLYFSVKNNLAQAALVKATLWCIGEYSHLLSGELSSAVSVTQSIKSDNAKNDVDLLTLFDGPSEPQPSPPQAVTTNTVSDGHMDEIIEMVESISKHILTMSKSGKGDLAGGEYLLTCLGKLAARTRKSERLLKIIKKFRKHHSPELQQRACELDILIQEGLLNVIPLNVIPPNAASYQKPSSGRTDTPLKDAKEEDTKCDDLIGLIDKVPTSRSVGTSDSAYKDELLSLDDIGNNQKNDLSFVSLNDLKIRKVVKLSDNVNNDFCEFDPFCS